jgi:pimeloyl-ACP methyl ester carboxylesterase
MANPETPHFERISHSKYPLPAGLRAATGYVTVPEARSAASGNYPGDRTLRIYVTLVKSLSRQPAADPLVFLAGGPGGNSNSLLRHLGEPAAQQLWLGQRDLIVFDQRGTGFSEPALFAPELEPMTNAAFLTGDGPEVMAGRFVAAALRARQRFIEAGANLAAINTPEIAADIFDVCRALGYAQANLYGISYGTRPALAAMRDFPDRIRSVVLDSTVPMQVSQYVEAIPNARYAFHRVFEAVTADPRVNTVYPALESVFYDVFERLRTRPVKLPARHPLSQESIELRLSGEVFLGILCNAFYDTAAIAALPRRIYQAYRGEYGTFGESMLHLLDDQPSDLPGWGAGMYYSVNFCDDKVTAATAAAIREQARQVPAMASLPLTEFHLGPAIADLAAAWGARPAGPAEYQPVVSDIPTLILAGGLDQNTPAFWGRLAGETLANSWYVEVPGAGHGICGDWPCVDALIERFFEEPRRRPDDACVSALDQPNFVLP